MADGKFVGDGAEGVSITAWIKKQIRATPGSPTPAEIAQAMLSCALSGDKKGLAALRVAPPTTGDDAPEPGRAKGAA